jgi:hypothetical protein
VPQVGDFVAVDEPLFNLRGGAASLDDQALRANLGVSSVSVVGFHGQQLYSDRKLYSCARAIPVASEARLNGRAERLLIDLAQRASGR